MTLFKVKRTDNSPGQREAVILLLFLATVGFACDFLLWYENGMTFYPIPRLIPWESMMKHLPLGPLHIVVSQLTLSNMPILALPRRVHSLGWRHCVCVTECGSAAEGPLLSMGAEKPGRR